ncbi:MAG: DNA-3-methyladenine glycosylase I, partial [Longicatena sp.]
MEKQRCLWANNAPELYKKYHDEEWGVSVHDDHKLFEMLVLESFQAGLSWLTILKKRENFRKAFDNFDVRKVAQYDEEKIAELTSDKSIIRNSLKIKATIKNAQVYIAIQEEFGSFST